MVLSFGNYLGGKIRVTQIASRQSTSTRYNVEKSQRVSDIGFLTYGLWTMHTLVFIKKQWQHSRSFLLVAYWNFYCIRCHYKFEKCLQLSVFVFYFCREHTVSVSASLVGNGTWAGGISGLFVGTDFEITRWWMGGKACETVLRRVWWYSCWCSEAQFTLVKIQNCHYNFKKIVSVNFCK